MQLIMASVTIEILDASIALIRDDENYAFSDNCFV